MTNKERIEDLLTEFDEFGMKPTILVPDPEEMAKAWKHELEYETKLLRDEGEAWYKKCKELEIELKAMRSAANSLKMHLEKAKAEVEEWKANANDWQNQYFKQIKELEIYQEHIDQDIIYAKAIKADAIKEFAVRLRRSYYDLPTASDEEGYDYVCIEAFQYFINDLVAEMTEGE